MATAQTTYGIVSLPERLAEGEDDRGFVRLREDLDVGAFGVGATFQRKAGEDLIRAHHEAGPGSDRHEELYIVVQGSATFKVGDETFEAPQGSTVFVRDPEVTREAIATEDDTIVVAVGGRRGEAYRLSPAMSANGFYRAYQAGDYAEALAATNRGLESYPGNAYLLYNASCMQSLLGDHEAALANLAESVSKWEDFKEMARTDDDFASLREDPRFVELVA